MLNFVEK